MLVLLFLAITPPTRLWLCTNGYKPEDLQHHDLMKATATLVDRTRHGREEAG